jgi:predicted nucleotidyltransferase
MCSERLVAVTKNPIESKRDKLEALCERHVAECLALFGSALRDDLDPDKSDLDFFVEFQPMTPHEHAASYSSFLRTSKTCSGGVWTWRRSGPSEPPYLRREMEKRKQTQVGCCDCS